MLSSAVKGRVLGIAGLGASAYRNLEAIGQFDNLPDLAIWTSDKERNSYIARLKDLPFKVIEIFEGQREYYRFCQTADCGIFIGNKPYEHYEMLYGAFCYSELPILVEKPVVFDPMELENLEALFESSRVQVACQLNYHPAFQNLAGLAHDYLFGNISEVKISLRKNLTPAEWRKDRTKAGGGILMDMMPHYMGVLQLFPELWPLILIQSELVYAEERTETDIELAGQAWFTGRNGALIEFDLSTITDESVSQFLVVGNQILVLDFLDPQNWHINGEKQPFCNLRQHLMVNWLNGNKLPVGLEQGCEHIKLINECYSLCV
jgi:predicted dehydrogenase